MLGLSTSEEKFVFAYLCFMGEAVLLGLNFFDFFRLFHFPFIGLNRFRPMLNRLSGLRLFENSIVLSLVAFFRLKGFRTNIILALLLLGTLSSDAFFRFHCLCMFWFQT